MKKIKKMIRVFLIILMGSSLQGCLAGLGVVAVGLAATGAALTVAAVVTVINLATDQYPNIDFEKPAAVEIIYSNSYDNTWNKVVDTLYELTEQVQVSDKSSGIIRTAKSSLNDVTWINKALGKATFKYEYNIIVRRKSGGTSVRVAIPFWSEKVFVAEKQKNIPEGSNTLRHIFFNELRPKLNAKTVYMPSRPDQDVRRTALNRVSWSKYKSSTYIDQSKGGKSQSRVGGTGGGSNLSNYPKDVVASVQVELNKRAYNAGPADGLYGGKTRKEVKQFQKDNGLKETGELDDKTFELLGIAHGSDKLKSSGSKTNNDTSEGSRTVEAPSKTKAAVESTPDENSVSLNTGSVQLAKKNGEAVTAIDSVFVFAEQDAFSDIKATLDKGKRVTVIERTGDWSQIKVDSIDGFVYTDDLSFAE